MGDMPLAARSRDAPQAQCLHKCGQFLNEITLAMTRPFQQSNSIQIMQQGKVSHRGS